MAKCNYRGDWLNQVDKNNYKVKEWGKKYSDEEMFCMVCSKKFSIVKGFAAINKHASTEKHKIECKQKLISSQLKLQVVRPILNQTDGEVSQSLNEQSNKQSNTIKLVSSRDSAIVAELIWVMKCVKSNYSFNSNNDIEETFRSMFPSNGAVPETFSLKPTKVTYLLTEALATYFRSQLIKDINNSYYTIKFDETTNNAGKKELEIAIRYWSESQSRVVTQHLQTYFIGKARAKDLLSKLYLAINDVELSQKKMLMLGSDGPYVNKLVLKMINQDFIQSGRKPLIDLGTCNIHILHNAYLKGLEKFGDEISDFLTLVHAFFNKWPARRGDFKHILEERNIPELHFITHVSSRWLTLETSAERAYKLLKPLTYYIMNFIPQQRPLLVKASSYQRLVKYLKNPLINVELRFVICSARLFTKFTRLFQRDEPLIHVMYSELETLAINLIGRICKKDSIEKIGICDTILENKHLLPIASVKCGDDVEAELETSKTSDKDKLVFRQQVREHFLAAAKHLLHKSSLKIKPVLKSFKCLHPHFRKDSTAVADIVFLAKSLPIDVNVDFLHDEWLMLQLENDRLVYSEGVRIDEYWAQFFNLQIDSGNIKYPNVSIAVKAALSLSHGNAFVERIFSDSGRTLTGDRASMSEKTLNAAITVKRTLQLYNNNPSLVPITTELRNLSRCANSKYQTYLESMKKEKEQSAKKREEEKALEKHKEELKKKLDLDKKYMYEDEEKLKKLHIEEKEKRTIADKMLNEASERLKSAIEEKNMLKISMAQLMLDSASNAKRDADKKYDEIKKLQRY